MMEKKSRFSAPAVGGSSLLVIFAVLTLSVFAFLSLSTAQAERRLSDANRRAVSACYEADSRAEEIFARLRSGELPQEVTKSENTYSYICPISENQQLVVKLRFEDGDWEILRWQAVAQMPEASGETMPVWDGNTP